MKKITYIVISLLLMVSYSYGQGEVEANQFSRNDLFGTARAISMGGAFGALGGDLTGVAINPAGIAVYRSSEIATTAVFQNENFKAGDISNTINKFNFHNFGFVGYFPTANIMVPVVNFGFAYNKVKSFDREIGAFGLNRMTSMMDYMSHVSNVYDKGRGIDPSIMEFDDKNSKYDPFLSGAPWLSILGYNSYLINPGEGSQSKFYSPLHDEKVNNSLQMSEKGAIDTYDFTVGTSINNVLNLGISLSLTDIYYNLYSKNSEDFSNGNKAGFDLHNYLVSEGNGLGVKLGVIYRPVNELRLGLSYHSPTWYTMRDRFTGEIEENVENYLTDPDYKSSTTFSGEKSNDYNFKTPDKWTVSAAAVLGTSMILSLDYELMNYRTMKFSEPTGSEFGPEFYDNTANSFIESDFKTTSSVRAGFEYRFTPQFSGRLGYAWMQNPYDTTFKNDRGDAMTVGSTTAYRIEGDASHFTGGFGYRFNRNFYADLALVYKTQEDELYSYPNVFDETGKSYIDAAPYNLTNTSIRALVTIGYRF